MKVANRHRAVTEGLVAYLGEVKGLFHSHTEVELVLLHSTGLVELRDQVAD